MHKQNGKKDRLILEKKLMTLKIRSKWMGLTHQNLVCKSVVKWEKSNKSNQVFLKEKKKIKGTNTISIDSADFKEK